MADGKQQGLNIHTVPLAAPSPLVNDDYPWPEAIVKRPQLAAEVLLELADEVLLPKRNLLVVEGELPGSMVAKIALALILKKRPALAFKALVEELSLQEIVREVW